MPQQSKIVFAGVEAAAFEISFQAIFQNCWDTKKNFTANLRDGKHSESLAVSGSLLPHRRLAVASSSLRIRPSEHVPLSRTKDAQLHRDAGRCSKQHGTVWRFV